MAILNKKEPAILLIGDLLFFFLSLWIALYLRYSQMPTAELWYDHAVPFGLIFLVWVLVFFIAGLYDKQTVIFTRQLPALIFRTQVMNSIIAVVFFYFIPYFGITPKTNLFIDLVVSFIFVSIWRVYVYQALQSKKKQKALLLGSGREMDELYETVNSNPNLPITFISRIDLAEIDNLNFHEDIVSRIYADEVTLVVIDLRHPKAESVIPHLYNFIFFGVEFIDMYKVYEDIFGRVPLSLLKYSWFLENVSTKPHPLYDFLKRFMDIFISFVLGLISLLVYPFVMLAMLTADSYPFFFKQRRVGTGNQPIDILKFRTMPVQEEEGLNKNDATKIGKFLRKSRIDEIPQLWNVFKGDVSLIGPRPEMPELVKVYEKQVPYYNVRHLIKPGLSGWAQIYQEKHPHHEVAVVETSEKLSYDLFYLKNRSFLLDLKIALQTVKIIFSRKGR